MAEVEPIQVLVFEIAKLELERDDVLVIKLDENTMRQYASSPDLGNYLNKFLPRGIKVLVISPGTDLSVIRAADIRLTDG